MEMGGRRPSLAWVLVAALIIGLMWWGVRAGWPGIDLPEGTPAPSGWEELRVNPGAEISFYYACGRCPYPDPPPAEDVEGLTYSEILERFPLLDIRTFTPDMVDAHVTDELCEAMETHMTVILDAGSGTLTVRHGFPDHLGPPHPLGEAVRSLDPARLSAADRAMLERGVVVRDEAEMWSLLEGLGH